MASRKIPIKDVIDDLRNGLGDVPVMEKYVLSPAELMVIKRRWQQGKQITEDWSTTTQLLRERRALPRCQPLYKINVYVAQNPQVTGVVNDIHRKGLQVLGVTVMMDEVRNLVIPAKPYNVHADIMFEAQCRWSMINDYGHCVAGFRITVITAQATDELQKLLDSLTCL